MLKMTLNSCQQSICVLLDVKDMDHVIPCLQQYQVMLKAMKDMEKVGIVKLSSSRDCCCISVFSYSG